MQLLNLIKSLFSEKAHQANLDAFISSKQPTSVAEVEHWIRIYDHSTAKGCGL
jgi:hypothetical protein